MEYSIGVVTYVARFEKFLMPLIKQLTEVFPDKEIICIVNGHHDELLQINYLKQVTAFLNQFPNVHYLTYEKHQPLAKCFNWIALMSFAPRMLILNDDVSLNLLFRREFEKNLTQNNSFFVINYSWSHFLISKDFIKKIGWFEERLLGTGQEDGDYHIRIVDKGKEVTKMECHGIVNYVAPQDNAGWTDISKNATSGTGKTAAVNDEFFYKKYPNAGKCAPGMETPVFYNFSSLDNNGVFVPKYNTGRKPSLALLLLLPFNMIYSYSRKTVSKMYRYVKGMLR
ncbi:MAG: hypothetical protein AAB797_00365 [Patescibacteria group bacterium]